MHQNLPNMENFVSTTTNSPTKSHDELEENELVELDEKLVKSQDFKKITKCLEEFREYTSNR